MKLNPFFELNGKKYEIKRTRFLEVEYEKIREQDDFTDEQQKDLTQLTKLQNDYQKIYDRYRELEYEYLEDFDEEKERKYLKAKELADKTFKELAEFEIQHKEVAINKVQKVLANKAEKILIAGLASQYFVIDKDNNIFDYEKAERTWCDYVDKIGVGKASEWVLFMFETLFNNEEDDDPFLQQARARAEQQAVNRRNGLAKMKR